MICLCASRVDSGQIRPKINRVVYEAIDVDEDNVTIRKVLAAGALLIYTSHVVLWIIEFY